MTEKSVKEIKKDVIKNSRYQQKLLRTKKGIAEKASKATTNPEKEILGEAAANLTMERARYKKLPSKIGSNNGFDGVYVKYKPDGKIQDIIINESKFRTSQLSITKNGKQMSQQWIETNIRKMLKSSDQAVKETGKILDENIEIIRTKLNRLTPDGLNKWESNPGGWGK